MASVWCAEDLVLRRSVAVKVLSERYAHDPVAVRRFKREARAAARVSAHPHVVTIFDVGDLEPDQDATASGGRAPPSRRRSSSWSTWPAARWPTPSASGRSGGRRRCGGSHRRPRRSTTRTSAGWSIVTSSPATSCSTTAGPCTSPTSGSPACRARTPSPAAASCSGRPPTWRPSRRWAARPPAPPIAIRWPWPHSSCSRGSAPSRPPTSPPRPASTSRSSRRAPASAPSAAAGSRPVLIAGHGQGPGRALRDGRRVRRPGSSRRWTAPRQRRRPARWPRGACRRPGPPRAPAPAAPRAAAVPRPGTGSGRSVAAAAGRQPPRSRATRSSSRRPRVARSCPRRRVPGVAAG